MNLMTPVNERDHVLGPSDAAVTVVNYGDYECPDCHKRHRAVEKMVAELRNTVRFVYRHFPLVKVHPRALRAAEAAEAAAAQGKFWEMHRRLYLRPDKLGERDLRRHARELGLDLARFDRELASGTYAEQIRKDWFNSVIYGITAAPTTFINGVHYALSGVELLATVQTRLKEQRASSSELSSAVGGLENL
jgi:formate-nitrite transporter family protein